MIINTKPTDILIEDAIRNEAIAIAARVHVFKKHPSHNTKTALRSDRIRLTGMVAAFLVISEGRGLDDTAIDAIRKADAAIASL